MTLRGTQNVVSRRESDQSSQNSDERPSPKIYSQPGGLGRNGFPQLQWYEPDTKNHSPGPRAAHSCDVMKDKMFVFGGWNGKQALNDLSILNLPAMEWIHVTFDPHIVPAERNNHTTVAVGSRLFVHGGHDGKKWLADLHILETEPATTGRYTDMEWSTPEINGTCPTARACHTLTRVNDKLYMFGGYDGTKCFNEIEIIDLKAMAWIKPTIKGALPQARNAHTMTVVNKTRLALFGGHSGNKHLTDLHIFDTETFTWTQPKVTGTAPPGLRGHTANLIEDKIFLFGGYDGKGRSNDLYILDTSAFGPCTPRRSFVHQDSTCGRGGSSGSSSGEPGESITWVHPSESRNAPSGRQRHSASLIGFKHLYVFGGFDGNKWLNDLHVLDISRIDEDSLHYDAVENYFTNIKRFRNLGGAEFSDVTLVVESCEGEDGETIQRNIIPAHRFILASQCQYFHKMFAGNMKEARENEIILTGWSFAAYSAMIAFLYTAEMEENQMSVVLEILSLADHYGLDVLKLQCEKVVRHAVEVSNVCQLFSDADKYKAAELKSFCLKFIVKNIDQLRKLTSFQTMDQDGKLMMEIFQACMEGKDMG